MTSLAFVTFYLIAVFDTNCDIKISSTSSSPDAPTNWETLRLERVVWGTGNNLLVEWSKLSSPPPTLRCATRSTPSSRQLKKIIL
ncbi:hypothetical protein [Nostoc linckia]|uniref:hypothetical protein n=1 Tax=Nostoc linckia TaxID=92942 RepID=UPI00117CBF02|nr:hypothetical protein [Nostoc linckia]